MLKEPTRVQSGQIPPLELHPPETHLQAFIIFGPQLFIKQQYTWIIAMILQSGKNLQSSICDLLYMIQQLRHTMTPWLLEKSHHGLPYRTVHARTCSSAAGGPQGVQVCSVLPGSLLWCYSSDSMQQCDEHGVPAFTGGYNIHVHISVFSMAPLKGFSQKIESTDALS